MGRFNNKKQVTEHIYADTVVWQCSHCNCWSRDEFVYVDEPSCPICNNSMERVTKNIRVE